MLETVNIPEPPDDDDLVEDLGAVPPRAAARMRTVDTPLSLMLRQQIFDVLNEGAFTSKTCNRVGRLAKAARELLRAVDGVGPKRRRSAGLNMGYVGNPDEFDDDDGQLPTEGGMLGGYNSETYGNSMVKETLAALKDVGKKQEPMHQLIRAYRDAKTAKLHDVAAALKSQIEARAQDAAPPKFEVTVRGAGPVQVGDGSEQLNDGGSA